MLVAVKGQTHAAIQAPAGSLDPVTIYDGPRDTVAAGSSPGGISKVYLYQGWLPWKNVGGDWVDAAGTAQGTVPFFQLTLSTGQVGKVQADATALIKKDRRMMLRGDAKEACVFAARGAGRVGPTLIYDTPTGQVIVPCIADDEVNPSTEYEQGDSPTLSTNIGNAVYIAFPDVPPVGWTKATLELTIVKEYTGGKLNAFQFQWGGLPPMPNPTDTLTLKGDPRVFFETADFTDIPPYLKAAIFGDSVNSMNLDKYQQRNLVKDETGKTVLQITFDPHVNAALVASILFPNGDEVDEAAVECEIRFLPDMLTGLTQGFKCFAGFGSATRPDDAYFAKIWGTQVGRCGTQVAGNGGSKAHGNDGWSTRFDMMKSPRSDHPLYGHIAPMQYVYWPEQKDYFGDAFLWNGAGFTPRVNEWHRFTTRLLMNTCTGTNFQKNAELDCFIDGILSQCRRGFYLRTTDDPLIMHAPYNVQDGITYDVRSKLRIARVWLNGYHGGTELPLSRCSYQIRNLRVAKFK